MSLFRFACLHAAANPLSVLRRSRSCLDSRARWLIRFAATSAPAVELTSPGRRPFSLSPEQQAVVDRSWTQNVVVSARPGAGKTATAEAIVAANPDRAIAILTYSKRLQLEATRKLESYPRCDVYTFHGMAGKLFSTIVPNDSVLHSLRRRGSIAVWNREPYDTIVLDELQDCSDDLFWLICAFISSVTHAAGGRAPQIVALGDEKQAIYDFRGADSRFLSFSPELLTSLSPYDWSRLPLSKSFRLSRQNSSFVNQVFLNGEEYITGSHDGPKPLYLHADLRHADTIAERLLPLIERYGQEQTAILAPFVRNNWRVSLQTNLLTKKYGIDVATPISDETTLDDDVLAGKLCVSTYHQFKGNERDLVIVYGVDNGYFSSLARDLPTDICPNATFVALTRAREQLVVMHDADQALMPFVSLRAIHKEADFVGISPKEVKQNGDISPPSKMGLLLPRNIFVSDMTRHVPDKTLDSICEQHIKITKLAAPLPRSMHIDAPDKVLTNPMKMHYEAVSDLNGIAVVAAYEHDLLGSLTTLGYKKRERPALMTEKEAQAAWLTREACQYEARLSGYESRSIQMKHHNFNWLGPYLDAAKERLQDQLEGSKKLQFEYKFRRKGFLVDDKHGGGEAQETCLRGRADIVRHHKITAPGLAPSKPAGGARRTSRNTFSQPLISEAVSIWEIKFVIKLSLEHAIQACAYAYLWAVKHRKTILPRIILFNVRDGEMWEMMAPEGTHGLRKLLEEVLRAKYLSKGELSTDEFLEKCAKTRQEVEKYWEAR